MTKTFKIIKITFTSIFILIIFIIKFQSEKITIYYNLPKWIIPIIFYTTIIYIIYKYLVYKLKDGQLEKEMISIINHAFRTPLTSTIWYIKELEKNISQNEKLLYLQNLDNSINKVLGVVDILAGINNFKNTSGYFFQAVSLREIVENSIKKYREQINKKNLSFQVSSFKDIPLLTVDLKKISFVIDAIIENAILYTNKEGKILIDCISNSKKIILFISDTGIGLSFTDKIRIFTKFYRNKKAKNLNTDGLGLRLYLSKNIIKKHNGKIYAKSNGQGEGSTFFIELPFVK